MFQINSINSDNDILIVNNLSTFYPVYGGIIRKIIAKVHAVDNVSLRVEKGEIIGLVGESGCGKTTLGRNIVGLLKYNSGEIYFNGRNINHFKGKDRDRLRHEMQMIFQNISDSLDPRMNVYNVIKEAVEARGIKISNEKEVILKLLNDVELSSYYFDKFPHELSGGEKQRVAIARALAVKPKLIVADEPVSSLDVSIQANILNLLKNLNQEQNLAILFITHNLSVVRQICNRLLIMYLGRILEWGSTEEVMNNPLNPYTQALLSAIPIPDPKVKSEQIILRGELPSPLNPPSGCRLHTQCPYAMPICIKTEPTIVKVSDEHFVRCHKYS